MKSFYTLLVGAATAVVILVAQASAESKGVSATLIGENYCLHCALVMEEGSEAECGPETCSYALKVKEAKDADGKSIESLKGATVHYIKSEAASALASGPELLGEEVEVSGTVFIDEHAVDVKAAAPYDALAELDDWIWDEPGNRASARR